MRYILLILFLLAFGAERSDAQTIEDRIKQGLDYTYNVKFDSAKVIFDDIVRSEPNNPRGYFLLALVEWWKININKEDESNDEKFYETVEKVEEVADEVLDKNENDDNAMFYKGGAVGLRGLLRSVRDSWLKAAEDGRKALNLLQRSVEVNPNNKDGLFGIGVYNYFAEYVPDRYPAVKPLLILFPKGNKVQGLLQIQETSQNSRIASSEATFILAYLNLKYEKNIAAAEQYSKKLHEMYPDNPLFEKYLYECYLRQDKLIEALEGWKRVVAKADSGKFGYTKLTKALSLYHVAVTLQKLGQFPEAEQYALQALDVGNIAGNPHKELQANNFMILGMLNDVKGNRNEAVRYYDLVLSLDNFGTSHRDAENFKINAYGR